jgi:hypothetical protein
MFSYFKIVLSYVVSAPVRCMLTYEVLYPVLYPTVRRVYNSVLYPVVYPAALSVYNSKTLRKAVGLGWQFLCNVTLQIEL